MGGGPLGGALIKEGTIPSSTEFLQNENLGVKRGVPLLEILQYMYIPFSVFQHLSHMAGAGNCILGCFGSSVGSPERRLLTRLCVLHNQRIASSALKWCTKEIQFHETPLFFNIFVQLHYINEDVIPNSRFKTRMRQQDLLLRHKINLPVNLFFKRGSFFLKVLSTFTAAKVCHNVITHRNQNFLWIKHFIYNIVGYTCINEKV